MITDKLEKHDIKRLENFIKKYEEYKRGLNNEVYSERRANTVRNIVDSFERTYEECGDVPKKIMQMTWLQPETDEVICKVLEIPRRRLLRYREKILIKFADEMVYV
ncbi:hypothetical protein [Staphylococcus equorum]|uniref:hypothetical protein n=1 Tax=Staphylococcus equorum TaxID=246432 RepID=UPI003EBB920D